MLLTVVVLIVAVAATGVAMDHDGMDAGRRDDRAMDSGAMDGGGGMPGGMVHEKLPAMDPLTGYSLYHLDAVWTDHRGDSFPLAHFRGRPVIVTMIFTRCVGSCPVLMQDARRLYNELPPELREETALLGITFDHEYDTPEVLRSYAEYRHYNDPNWHFLHGDRGQIREIATALGIQYSFRDNGMIAHTDRIVVLDREGQIVDTLDGILQPVQAAAQALTAAVR